MSFARLGVMVAFVVFAVLPAMGAPNARPNVLFIAVDDMNSIGIHIRNIEHLPVGG